MVALDTQGII